MYEVVYTRQAVRSMRRLPRNLLQRVQTKLSEIASDPYSQHNNVTKLQNRDGYRLRVGDWRIIYELEDDQLKILVLRIAPRGNIYR